MLKHKHSDQGSGRRSAQWTVSLPLVQVIIIAIFVSIIIIITIIIIIIVIITIIISIFIQSYRHYLLEKPSKNWQNLGLGPKRRWLGAKRLPAYFPDDYLC